MIIVPGQSNPSMGHLAPTEQEVFAAFASAKAGSEEVYNKMDFGVFFYGWLVGKGWNGPEAAAFVAANPVGG